MELGARFVGAFLGQLLLGGLAVLLGPKYVRKRISDIRDRPGEAFLWGLIVTIPIPIVLVLIAITIIGLVVTIPGLILVAVVGLVGNAVSIVWIGSLLTATNDRVGGKEALLGAVVLAVPAAIPVLGNFVTSIVGLFGTGVVGKTLYESWRD
jgi:MFS family permease